MAQQLPEATSNDLLFFVTIAYSPDDCALPGMVGFLPCFESYDAALRAADGREEFVQVIEKVE